MPNPPPFRLFCRAIICLVVLCMMFEMCGCGATEKKRIGQAVIAIDGSAQAGTVLLRNHLLSPATAQALVDALETAQAAVDAWDHARLAGDKTTTDKAGAAALAAITNLNTVLADAQVEAAKKTTTATTRPD